MQKKKKKNHNRLHTEEDKGKKKNKPSWVSVSFLFCLLGNWIAQKRIINVEFKIVSKILYFLAIG